jgi:hypothetical protein
MNEDLLESLLRAALAEGALDADSLPRFAEALRARAALILAERVLPLAERAGAFETESTWRAGVMAGLEKEREALIEQDRRRVEECRNARAEVEALQAQTLADRLAHRQEMDFREREIEALKAAVEAARREQDVASAAHDRLLAHHRATLAQVAETLRGLSQDLPWRYRRARAAALELLRLLEKDTR